MNFGEFICFSARFQSYPWLQRAYGCKTTPLYFTSRPLFTVLLFLLLPRPRLWGQMYVPHTLRNKRDFNHTVIELSGLDKTFKIIESSQVCDCCLWTPKLLVIWKKSSQTHLCTLHSQQRARQFSPILQHSTLCVDFFYKLFLDALYSGQGASEISVHTLICI